jgi:hypothetical protein
MAGKKEAPVFGRPKNWDKLTPEEKHQWALEMLAAATGKPLEEPKK